MNENIFTKTINIIIFFSNHFILLKIITIHTDDEHCYETNLEHSHILELTFSQPDIGKMSI